MYVHFVTTTAVLTALKVSEVGEATTKDALLRLLRDAIQTGQWSNTQLKQFESIKDEPTIDYNNSVLLRGSRIIILASRTKRVIQLAHEGYQGLARTKSLLREHVWFPDMDKAVTTHFTAICTPYLFNSVRRSAKAWLPILCFFSTIFIQYDKLSSSKDNCYMLSSFLAFFELILRKRAKLCKQACVERRTSNAV